MKAFVALLVVALPLSFGQALAAVDDEVKTVLNSFIAAQNAHDLSSGRSAMDSPDFLWVTRGAPIWGRDAAPKRFESLYQGTWKLSPEASKLKIVLLSDTSAQLFVPIMFNVRPPGQPALDTLFLMNQTIVKTRAGWRIASILPIPVPTPAGSK